MSHLNPPTGSFSLSELTAHWRVLRPSEPQLLLDLGAWQEARRQENVFWLEQHFSWELTHHPLAAWHAPVLSVPALPEVTLPSIMLPTLSLPRVSLPQLSLTDTILPVASRLAFGASLACALFFAGPVVILEGQNLVQNAWQHLGNTRIASAPPSTFPQETPLSPTPAPSFTAPEDIFSLRIPSLEIASNVIANVDAGDKTAYAKALKDGVAHAAGSGLPDQLEANSTIYLFAHSTDNAWNIARYNAQFYALRNIEVGAEITIRFWGKDYTYRVEELKTVAADDTAYLQPQTDRPQLILQTCFPPGTTWKRLLVIAVPVE